MKKNGTYKTNGTKMTYEQMRIEDLEHEVKVLKAEKKVFLSAIEVLKSLLANRDRNDRIDAVGKMV